MVRFFGNRQNCDFIIDCLIMRSLKFLIFRDLKSIKIFYNE